MSSKVRTRNRLQGFEHLRTVFTMYNQELSRDRAPPSYAKLRRMVRQRFFRKNQKKTRNFKALNEIIVKGVLVKSQKGRKVSAERKAGECFQWKANGQCSRGDSCSFNHVFHSGQRAQSSSSTLRTPTQSDGRKPSIFRSSRGASPSGLKGRKPCKHFFGGTCTEPSCDLWHPRRVRESQI